HLDRRTDRRSLSLRGDGNMREDILSAPVSVPALALEHLEHGNVLGVERITLDLLQDPSFKAPLACGGDFFRGQSASAFLHELILPKRRKCHHTSVRALWHAFMGQRWTTIPV